MLSSTPPLATVVPIRRGISVWPPVLRQAWETLEKVLRPAYATWGEASDDALFHRSESAANGQQYFDAMRLLRRIRPQLEADIQRRFRDGAEIWLGEGSQDADAGKRPVGLSLVGNEELEEALAVAAMGERALREAGPQWEALRRRIAHVRQVSVDELPFEPAALAKAVCASLDAIEEFDTPIRLTLLKLFERHAWPLFSSAVVTLNQQLIEQGVLPNLKAPTPQLTRPPSSSAEAFSRSPTEQVTHRPAAEAGVSSAAPEGWTAQNTQELLSVLAQLRPSSEFQGTSQPSSLPSPSALRDQLLSSLPAQVRHADHEQAIDLVALVFEFLLKDNDMPSAVQAMLARLQLPYLRVAVIDPHGFAQATHPARLLLDVLGQVGQTWSEADDHQGELLTQLRLTVDRLADAHETDLNVFVTECDRWRLLQEKGSKRAVRVSDRTIATQSGQERLVAAQHAVAQVFVQRLGALDFPAHVRVVLQHWKAAMTLIWLREGPDSSVYRNAVFLLDQLRAIRQVKPGTEVADRLDRMRPTLRSTLDKGWRLLDMDDATRHAMIGAVDGFLGECTGHPVSKDNVDFSPPPVPRMVKEVPAVLPLDHPLPAPSSEDAPKPVASGPVPVRSDLEEVEPAQLAVGTWMEFEHANITHRGKLSWISPFTRRWLMVSAAGLKITDLDPREVTLQLKDGRAQVVSAQGLVTRALAAKDAKLS